MKKGLLFLFIAAAMMVTAPAIAQEKKECPQSKREHCQQKKECPDRKECPAQTSCPQKDGENPQGENCPKKECPKKECSQGQGCCSGKSTGTDSESK